MRRSTGRTSPRRRTIWIRGTQSITTAAGTGYQAFSPLSDAPAGALLGATVTRIRGSVLATNSTLIGLGVLGFKVQDNVATLPVGENPLAVGGREDDWLGWVPFSYRPALNSPETVHFDIKGQRRMDELGMTLIGAVDVGTTPTATGINVIYSVLITLP